MTAIWSEDAEGWRLLSPAGFPDERSLHELVAKTPDLLPLSGSPRMVVLGTEVLLGSGYADVFAIEPEGRPVIIEVKLRNNSESRRAVVSQVLAYAAALYGSTAEDLERDTMASRLAGRTLFDVVRDVAQSESLDADEFYGTLTASLQDGSFRVVLVLDQAPEDLVTLVGYLEAVTDALLIDLVTVTAYDVAGHRVVVPQRVESGRPARPREPSGTRAGPGGQGTIGTGKGQRAPGVEPFRQQIATAPERHQPVLEQLAAWADRVAAEHLAEVSTHLSSAGAVLLLHLLPERGGLATVWRAPTAHHRSSFGARSSNAAHPLASSPSRHSSTGCRSVKATSPQT